VKAAARAQNNPNFIKMFHGHLEINVPRRLFKDGTAEMIPAEVETFRKTVSSRYPWLSRYALDEVVKEAQEAMTDHIERSKTAPQRAREQMARGHTRIALRILEEHLIDEPEDAEAWYASAEVLFKLDRGEDAFRAMNRARDLSKKVTRRAP
jgi:cytochrome c-type biogenesis protein CcmH/NrfG